MTAKKSEQKNLFPGKLPHNLLSRLLEQYALGGENVYTGAMVGEDATVIEQADHFLIAKTDPITFVTDNIGYYVVHVNANDIYCMGGKPKWFLATLLLPENDTSKELVERIFAQIADTCRNEHVAYCGGHTEITLGLDRPIVVGQMLGEVAKDRLLRKTNIKKGDHIILAQAVPIEGTAIIAREKYKKLVGQFAPSFLTKCQNMLFRPGISVRPAAQIAVTCSGVHAMHDPTEGGLATALYELTQPSGLSVEIDYQSIPILKEGQELCKYFSIDPLGVIASGSLLIVADERGVDTILSRLHECKIPAADIGRVIPGDRENILIINGMRRELPVFAQDEIVKIF